MSKETCSFTVVKKDGLRYSATLIIPTVLDGTSDEAISFLCSGIMMTFPLTEVMTVEYKQWDPSMNIAPNV